MRPRPHRFPTFLRLDEVAEITRAPIATVRDWVYRQKLQARRVGKHVLIAERDLMAYMHLEPGDLEPGGTVTALRAVPSTRDDQGTGGE
jgi:excisionase family DNA binding protein